MNSLGESGLSVFHAGHWLWQRPHSVQVAKSRMPLPGEVLDLPDAHRRSPRPSPRPSRGRTACRHHDRLHRAEGAAADGLPLQPDVGEGEEPVPGDAHRGVHRDGDHPDHRDDDLERRHDEHEVLQRRLGETVEERTAPGGEREVQGRGLVRVADVGQGVLEEAQRQDAEADGEDDPLDEVPLPHRGAVEPALLAAGPARRPGGAVDHERDDRDDHHPGEQLGDPLERREVADDRQDEVRVEELAVGVDQGGEQQPEADHDEPVRRTHAGPLEHPGVQQRLPGQRDRPGAPVVRARCAGWPTRSTARILLIARTNRATATTVIAHDTTRAMICNIWCSSGTGGHE